LGGREKRPRLADLRQRVILLKKVGTRKNNRWWKQDAGKKWIGGSDHSAVVEKADKILPSRVVLKKPEEDEGMREKGAKERVEGKAH